MPLPHLISDFHLDPEKALYALLVPIAQAVWKATQNRRADLRKKTLRGRISELAEFVKAPLDDSPTAALVREATLAEYREALAQLAALSSLQRKVEQRQVPIGAFRRWFLIYVPRTPAAWLPQILYFLALGFTVVAGIGIFSNPKDNDFIYALVGLAVFAFITWIFRAWAARANRTAAEDRPAARPVRRWIPITGIVVASWWELFGLIGCALDANGQMTSTAFRQNFSTAVTLTVMMGSIILACAYRLRKSKPPLKFEPLSGSLPASVPRPSANPQSTDVSDTVHHRSA